MFRCPICEDLHRVQRCRKYLAMSTSERWKTAKQSVFTLLNAKSWRRPFGSRKPKPSFSCETFQHLWRTITHYYYVILSLPDSVAPDVDDLLYCWRYTLTKR
ncbi:hypothetical protein T06_11103 [Trichinella sp. T6]|nr:hypothetical protein T06_11103 [Trichinella sp. T6]